MNIGQAEVGILSITEEHMLWQCIFFCNFTGNAELENAFIYYLYLTPFTERNHTSHVC